jgi:hypothetical protein
VSGACLLVRRMGEGGEKEGEKSLVYRIAKMNIL